MVDTLFDQLISFQLAALKDVTKTLHEVDAALAKKDNAQARTLAKEARATSDPAALDKVLARINTRMVDEAVFVWVVHDVWPNAISPKVKGYVHPKSWYVDFSPVTVG